MRLPAVVLVAFVCGLVASCCCTQPSSVRTPTVREAEPLAALTDDPAQAVYAIDTHVELVRGRKRIPLMAPRVSMRPLEAAHVTVIDQKSYVQDYDAELKGDMFLVDPVVGILQDGFVVTLAAAPVTASPSEVWCAFDATFAGVREPIREKKVRFHRGGHPGVLQLPELGVGSARGVRRLRTGVRSPLTSLACSGQRVEISVTIRPVGDVAAYKPPVALALADKREKAGIAPVLQAPVGEAFGPALSPPEVSVAQLARDAQSKGAPEGRVSLRFVIVRAPLNPEVVLDEAAARKLLARGARTVEAFELTCPPTGGTAASTMRHRAFVQDYDLKVGKEHAVADPLIGTVIAGRNAYITEGDNGLRLVAAWTTLDKSPTFKAQLDNGFDVEIELPELRIATGEMDLQPGRHLLALDNLISGGTAAVWIDYRP